MGLGSVSSRPQHFSLGPGFFRLPSSTLYLLRWLHPWEPSFLFACVSPRNDHIISDFDPGLGRPNSRFQELTSFFHRGHLRRSRKPHQPSDTDHPAPLQSISEHRGKKRNGSGVRNGITWGGRPKERPPPAVVMVTLFSQERNTKAGWEDGENSQGTRVGGDYQAILRRHFLQYPIPQQHPQEFLFPQHVKFKIIIVIVKIVPLMRLPFSARMVARQSQALSFQILSFPQ